MFGHRSSVSRSRSLLAPLAVMAAGAFVLLQAGVAHADAPGNNGTIKLGDAFVDDDNPEDNSNHPHLDCDHQLRWFGFDEGTQSTTVAFEAQAPSGSGAVPVISGSTAFDFAGGGSGDTLNHAENYRLDLTNFTAQDNQGYHVKVTVTVTGSQGNDTKTKVYWVAPCVAPSESPSPSPSVSVSPSPSVSPSVLASETVSSPSISPTVKGVKVVKNLPFTGSPNPLVVAFGFGLLLAGTAMLMTGRRRGAHLR